MAKKARVLLLRTAGTNCDRETEFAFKSFGAEVDLKHIKLVVSGKVNLSSPTRSGIQSLRLDSRLRGNDNKSHQRGEYGKKYKEEKFADIGFD